MLVLGVCVCACVRSDSFKRAGGGEPVGGVPGSFSWSWFGFALELRRRPHPNISSPPPDPFPTVALQEFHIVSQSGEKQKMIGRKA